MPKLERILCPVDFSEFSVCAYRHATSLAQHYGATLYVQHVVELWRHPAACFATPESYEQFRRSLEDEGQQKLLAFLKQWRPEGFEPQHVVWEGKAPDSILTHAEAEHMDLIVMGTHGRRGFDRLMVGSVTERVIRNASCPVLVVRGPSHGLQASGKEWNPVELRRILCCTDFSSNSRPVLEYASYLAAQYGSELILAHVLESTPHAAAFDETVAAAKERLTALLPAEGRDAGRHTAIVRVGKPYEQIITLCAETQCNLVVMAVRGGNAMDLSIFGSTTHRVIQLGPCPVLVVRG